MLKACFDGNAAIMEDVAGKRFMQRFRYGESGLKTGAQSALLT